MIKKLAHASAFILVAGSKTIYNVGQACLTVDATVMAIYCLSSYYNKPDAMNKNLEIFSIAMQVFAATISTTVVVWSRYKSISDNLSIEGIKTQYAKLQEELKDCNKKSIALFVSIAFFGVLSCVAPGLSAYLGTEVIFRERFKIINVGVEIAAWIIGITVTVSALCFNLSNMLREAAKYLNKPSFKISFKIVFGFIAVLSGAVVTRFFIKEFLDRRGVNETDQIIAQSVFFLAQFVMDCFTMGSSLKEGWWGAAKTTLKSSLILSTFMFLDVASTWLGYASITLYSILSNVFIERSASSHTVMFCPADQTSTDFALRWSFVGLALVIGVPMVISYFNYILDKTEKGYSRMVGFLKSTPTCCRDTLFSNIESGERKSLLENQGVINVEAVF